MSNTPKEIIPKPHFGLGDVSSLLQDMAITTYDVHPEKLQRLLPNGYTPQRFQLDNGKERALVSAVTFLNTKFFVRFAPFIQLECHQTNYRAYVQNNGKAVAWFFGTSLESFWTFVPQKIWGLPWHRSRTQHQTEWKEKKCLSYQWTGESKWGKEHLLLEGSDTPQGILNGFSSAEQCWSVLTHPFDGYFYLRDKHVGHYSVWHLPLQMKRAKVVRAQFDIFTHLGLTEPQQPPHSALIQREIQYFISLPPQKVDHKKEKNRD
jgi:uncharacterized protein YqjF (DUF2071 family)